MLDVLKKYSDCKPDSYVVSGANRSNITRTLHAMLKRAQCSTDDCGLHALRHSFATELFNQGKDIKTVSEILGHSDTKITTKIYIHVLNKKKLEAVNIFDKQKSITNIKESESILKILTENNIALSEIETGVLGYIRDNKIFKLVFTDRLNIGDIVILAKDIYNAYYNETDNDGKQSNEE